jgi:hypothetical protein
MRAVEPKKDLFAQRQKFTVETWVLRAVTSNQLRTDDTYVFCRAVKQIKVWESGRVGEWESGRVGEWESGRVLGLIVR